MAMIDPAGTNNPAEVPATSPQRVARITVVVHDFPDDPASTAPVSPLARRLRRLSAAKRPAPPIRDTMARQRDRGGRHHIEDRTWLDLAERALSSWPITLRIVLLLVVLLTGTVVLAAVLGAAVQLLLAVLGIRAQQDRRRRLAAFREERTVIEEGDNT